MPTHAVPPLRLPLGPATARLRRWMCGLGLATATLVGFGQTAGIRPAPAGLIETGVPAFTVYSPATLGLSASPTDLQALPDGRLLAMAGKELAFGDGTRWEVYRQAKDDPAAGSLQVAIDRDGRIYAGAPGRFARIEFTSEGAWHLVPVADTPTPDLTMATVTTEPGDWYWHGGSGAVLTWRPATPVRQVGQVADMERALRLNGQDYISDRADGSLWRVADGRLVPAIRSRDTNVSLTVTCGLNLGGGRLVVGTNGHGLQRFEASGLQPFLEHGPLATNNRINDLCATLPGLFAAAVDNLGIVFFDRQGRTVQVLDRSLDHRLSRVRRLFYTPNGNVWALLNDGIARVEFPSRLSHYEPLVSTGLVFAQPCRYHGALWLLADGKAQRGLYDDTGRLLRFEVDSPPEQFICAISTETGALLASGPAGIFRREAAGWVLVVPGLTNAHLCPSADSEGRWTFFAENEVGWLRPRADGYEVWRQPLPGAGGVYGAIGDKHGVLWAELGTSRIGRFDLTAQPPRAEYFTATDGLGGGWAQVSLLKGEPRFSIGGRMLRFDETTRTFAPDTEFLQAVPEAANNLLGRPAYDARGRLWLTAGEQVQVLALNGGALAREVESFPPGFQPVLFTPEDNGVVWLFQRLYLARFDPDMPQPPPLTPRALITQVRFTASNRTLIQPGARLPDVPAHDNSFAVQFMAVDAPPRGPVSFEVRLEGADREWVPAGVAGSAVFNRLKEGNYILHVRPLAQGLPGQEARLAFLVEPPWFRSQLAYLAYLLGAILFISLAMAYAAWRARQGKALLEQQVTQRTQELNTANRQLAANMEATLRQAGELRASEERYRQLSAALEQRVQERTEALVRANEQLGASNHELESFSYSVAHDLRAPLRNINGFVDLLRRRNRDLLDPESGRFFQIITTETVRLSQLIDSLLAFARLNRADLKPERVQLGALVEHVRADLAPECGNRHIEWAIGPVPTVSGDPTLLRQLVANLLHNALKFTRTRDPARIEIGVLPAPADQREQILFVRDNGVGFDPQYTAKLFGVFQRLHNVRDFDGVGIGLANAKRIVLRHGGRIWAEGLPDQGATFYFALPLRPAPSP
ncbi:MAG: hypothetical protein IPL39_02415 [Opitutaceae bacterium]|nr:hypothetical protein [Opitutaceae bacterium]